MSIDMTEYQVRSERDGGPEKLESGYIYEYKNGAWEKAPNQEYKTLKPGYYGFANPAPSGADPKPLTFLDKVTEVDPDTMFGLAEKYDILLSRHESLRSAAKDVIMAAISTDELAELVRVL